MTCSPAQAGAWREFPAASSAFVWAPAFAGERSSMKVPLSSKLLSPRAGGESRAWLPSARPLAGEGSVARASAVPHRRAPLRAPSSPALSVLAPLLLAGCAATQSAAAVQPQAPGFLLGLWHGFIFPIAWIVSLFVPNVGVYAVPNNGGWYDFGYFLGIVVFGVGARRSAAGINRGRNMAARGTTTIHHEERG